MSQDVRPTWQHEYEEAVMRWLGACEALALALDYPKQRRGLETRAADKQGRWWRFSYEPEEQEG
jgi:hypothetical protein